MGVLCTLIGRGILFHVTVSSVLVITIDLSGVGADFSRAGMTTGEEVGGLVWMYVFCGWIVGGVGEGVKWMKSIGRTHPNTPSLPTSPSPYCTLPPILTSHSIFPSQSSSLPPSDTLPHPARFSKSPSLPLSLCLAPFIHEIGVLIHNPMKAIYMNHSVELNNFNHR